MLARWSIACLVLVGSLGNAGCCLTRCASPCGCDVGPACGCPDPACGCPDASCGCPDPACGCPDACYDPACGCPDNCGSGVSNCARGDCPVFNFFGRIFGCSCSNCCGGCSSELYWHEWYNDGPCASEPCDQYGNFVGPGGAAYRAPYRRGAPLADAPTEDELGPEFEMARRPEPPVR